MSAEERIELTKDQLDRIEMLVRAGYDPHSAQLLADRIDIDLHKAVEMKEQGCTASLALRILL